MQSNLSLKNIRKIIFIRLALLFGVIILLNGVWRLATKNRAYFENEIIAEGTPEELFGIYPEWEGEGIPIDDFYSELKSTEEHVSKYLLHFTLRPNRQGLFKLNFYTHEGFLIGSDRIRVGGLMTVFDENSGDFTASGIIMLSGILFFLGIFIIMFMMFIRLEHAYVNSYEAVLCCGASMFSMAVLSYSIPYYLRHLLDPISYNVRAMVDDFNSGCKMLVRLSLPVLAVFCILLIVSNVFLLRYEGLRLTNVLGIGAGVLIGGAGLASYFTFRYVNSLWIDWDTTRVITILENTAGVTFVFAECILFSAMVCGYRASVHLPTPDKEYILILGCGLRADGTPSKLLKDRIDAAVSLWYRQKWETGTEAILVPSGGKGSDEVISEAEAMRNYLVEKGFPAEKILIENGSFSTRENMRLSKQVILEDVRRRAPKDKAESITDADLPPVGFVTTNYHVFRSGILANREGLVAEGTGARTKWWFWPNAFIRECVGFFLNPAVLIIFLSLLALGLVISIKLTNLMF